MELLARTRGCVHHSSITPNDEKADSATSTTSTSHGKTIDRGGKRASEANDHGGKRVSKDIATSSIASTHGSACEFGHSSHCWYQSQWTGPLPSERARNRVVIDRLANAAQLEPSNDPPSVAGCVVCGGVDPMYGGTISCPQCNQNLCPVCFPPTQHQPCCSSSSPSLEMILPSIIPFSSQYPLHFDTCAGKTASKNRQSTKGSLNGR